MILLSSVGLTEVQAELNETEKKYLENIGVTIM